MTHTFLFETDADNICMTVCPYHLTQGHRNELIRVGSYYERFICPYCIRQTDTEVQCGYPITTRFDTQKKAGQ